MDSKEVILCGFLSILLGGIVGRLLCNIEFHIAGLRIIVITIGTLLGTGLGLGLAILILFYLESKK